MSVDVATQSAIDAFLQAEAHVNGGLLDVDDLLRDLGAVTRWTFLCGLAAGRKIAFHRDRRSRHRGLRATAADRLRTVR